MNLGNSLPESQPSRFPSNIKLGLIQSNSPIAIPPATFGFFAPVSIVPIEALILPVDIPIERISHLRRSFDFIKLRYSKGIEKMPAPTKTQLRYLSFIHAYTEGFGQPPSMQEIAEALKVSSPSVNGMLKT
ncbi:MAG: hypothetical protein KDA87_24860, partial [Planctomycetales bacterium]|nr:hypothetical protein [Planctomycetales bacterium]